MLKRIGIKLRQVHKRRGFLAFSLAVLITLIALGVTMLASLNLNRVAQTGLLRISIDPDDPLAPILGGGVDVAVLPSTNMLRDDSFEPYVFRKSLTVEDGTDSVIIVPNEYAGSGTYSEGFFNGGNVRVTYQDSKGVSTKKTGKVVRFSPDQIAPFVLSPVTGDIPAGSKLNDAVLKDGTVTAVGENGSVVTGINSQSPTVRFSGISSDIISVTGNTEAFFACTEDGIIISSADGSDWETWISPENITLNAIAASENGVVAVGDSGNILLGHDGILYVKNLNIEDDITDIIYDDKRFVAVTSGGSILVSETGVVWRIASEQGFPFDRIDNAGQIFALTDDMGVLRIYKDIGTDAVSETYLGSGIIDSAVISGTKILALTEEGSLFETMDLGMTWKETSAKPPEKCGMIKAIGDGEIICSVNIRSTYVSRLVTEIELDSVLQSGTFQAGEFCFLSVSYPELPEEMRTVIGPADTKRSWEFYGRGSAEWILGSGAPLGGEGVVRLSCDPDQDPETGYSVISQRVTSQVTGGGLLPGEFYIFSIWIRQDSITPETVKVWLSGNYENIGTEFANVGTQWNKYTYKFSVPRNLSAEQASDIRINIGITGPGTFYFDRAYLGLVNHQEAKIPGEFSELVSGSSPSVIRMSWLGIGSDTTSQNSWAFDGSIEEGFGLAYKAENTTSPWISVDSHASESEIRNLLEYLAGPISSDFGSVRHRNGSPIPWSSRFEKIFLEFTDKSGIFQSDLSKAAYLNSCIQTVESSPYFTSLRNTVVLVDGMVYNDGLMLSRADYFSLDYICEADEILLKKIFDDLDRFVSIMPRNPERPADTPLGIIKSTDWGDNTDELDTADYTVFLLDTLGKQTAASLITWSSPYTAEISDPYIAAMKILSYAAAGTSLPLQIESQSDSSIAVNAYAFADGSDIVVVAASHDSLPSALDFDIPFNGRQASVIRFDRDGRVVEQRIVKRDNERINILPGNVVVFRLETVLPDK